MEGRLLAYDVLLLLTILVVTAFEDYVHFFTPFENFPNYGKLFQYPTVESTHAPH